MARPPPEPRPPHCKPDPTPSGAAAEMLENLRPEPQIWCCRCCRVASKCECKGDPTTKCMQEAPVVNAAWGSVTTQLALRPETSQDLADQKS